MAHQEQDLAHPIPAHPLRAQEHGNSLSQPCSMPTLAKRATKSPEFLYTQHCEERKHDPISLFWSLLFHFCFISWPATSLMPTPSSAAPNPGSNFPLGILNKINCLFVQGHLGNKRAASTAGRRVQMQTSTQSRLLYPMHQTCLTAHYCEQWLRDKRRPTQAEHSLSTGRGLWEEAPSHHLMACRGTEPHVCCQSAAQPPKPPALGDTDPVTESP